MKSVPPNLLPRFTEEEYLAFDRAAEYKNEFFGGAIRPMPNVSLRHSEIGVRVAAALFGERRSSGRHVFGCDARVRTPKSRSYLYPDAAVVCGAVEQEQGDILLNPVVIVEVLSLGTSDYDHGRKFAMYREIASLRDYVMVHTDSVWVEHWSKGEDDSWWLREYAGLEAEVVLPSIGRSISMKSIYEGLTDK